MTFHTACHYYYYYCCCRRKQQNVFFSEQNVALSFCLTLKKWHELIALSAFSVTKSLFCYTAWHQSSLFIYVLLDLFLISFKTLLQLPSLEDKYLCENYYFLKFSFLPVTTLILMLNLQKIKWLKSDNSVMMRKARERLHWGTFKHASYFSWFYQLTPTQLL